MASINVDVKEHVIIKKTYKLVLSEKEAVALKTMLGNSSHDSRMCSNRVTKAQSNLLEKLYSTLHSRCN